MSPLTIALGILLVPVIFMSLALLLGLTFSKTFWKVIFYSIVIFIWISTLSN